jgi:hypothetical protein
MKNNLISALLPRALAITALFASITASAGDAGQVFTVTEGASPWFDRVGQWSLTNIPDGLKGSGPLPQGDCSSRSLDVPGNPASITVGVQENDVASFTKMLPSAKDTGTQIGVKGSSGDTLNYMIFTVANPPAKIDGAGVFGAGLLLLKIEAGQAAPSAAPSGSPQPFGSPDASAPKTTGS